MISEVASCLSYEGFAVHDAIYRVFHSRTLEVDKEIDIIEPVVLRALGLAFRSAIGRIRLSFDAEYLP